MLIYFVVFFLSLLFISRAYKCECSDDLLGYKWNIVFSIFPLILMAAVRGDRVGIDVLGYQKDLFIHALNFDSPIDFIGWSYEEPLYSFVTFIGSRFGHMAFVHALNMSLILIPIYYVIWRMRFDIDPMLSLGTFLFLYYVQGYNMARQQIAISLLTLGVFLFADGKRFFGIVLAFLAVGFHYSAVAGLLLYFLWWVSKSQFKKIYQAILLILTVIVGLFFENIGRTAGAFVINMLHISKSSYRTMAGWFSSGDFNESYLLLGLLGFMFVFFNYRNYEIENINRTFLLYTMLVLLLSTIITRNMGFVARVFCYFEIWTIFSLPQSLYLVKDTYMNVIISRVIYFFLLSIYWILGTMYMGWHAVIPYYTFWMK